MSWDQLVSIKDEGLAYAAEERTEPPLACPYDGQPLLSTPDGSGLYCALGNYAYPQQPRII